MAMEQHHGTLDVLQDAKRTKTKKCKELDKQWDEMKRLVEEDNNIDSNYKGFLRSTLSSLDLHEHNKRETGNIICIEDDSDSETDDQYNCFLNGLNEHGKAHAYESSSDSDGWEYESRRNMNGHGFDIEDQSVKDSSTMKSPRLSTNLTKRVPTQKPTGCPRVKGSVTNRYGYYAKALSSRKNNIESYGLMGTRAELSLSEKFGTMMKKVQGKQEVQARLVEKVIVESNKEGPRLSTNLTKRVPTPKPTGCLRVKGSIKNRHGYDAKALSSRKNNIESCGLMGTGAELSLSEKTGTMMKKKVQREHEEQARLVTKEKVCSRVDKGHICHKKFEVYERRPRKFVSGMNVMVENQFEISERNNIRKERKRYEVAKRTNLVDDSHLYQKMNYDVAKRTNLVDNAHLYQKGNYEVADNMWDKRKNNVIQEDREILYQKTSTRNLDMMEHNRKLKGKSVVQEHDEKLHHRICPRNHYHQGCNGAHPCKKNEVHCHKRSIKVGHCCRKTTYHNVMMKGSNTKIDNVEFDKHLVGCKKRKRDLVDEETDDVEILNGDAYIEKGVMSSFVSAKKFRKSMRDDDHGDPSVPGVFRECVLSVLRKPFDKEEYRRHRKEIKDGCYLDYYPDVRKKLAKYRYKRGKCLTILRGFFFWLQNLTQEGQFQPWKDRECLAVEP